MQRMRLILLIAGLLLATTPLLAKGPADKITISGPGLQGKIEIVDPAILQQFNPWMAQFIDRHQSTPTTAPRTDRIYDVAFIMQDRPIYVVQYAPGINGDRGAIYLPGPGDPWYERNIGTIIQDGLDGKWQSAALSWDAAIQPLIEQHAVATLPATGVVDQAKRWLIVLSGALLSAGMLLCNHRQFVRKLRYAKRSTILAATLVLLAACAAPALNVTAQQNGGTGAITRHDEATATPTTREVILATQRDQRLHFFDAATLEPLGAFVVHSPAHHVSASSDGRTIFLAQGATPDGSGCCALSRSNWRQAQCAV